MSRKYKIFSVNDKLLRDLEKAINLGLDYLPDSNGYENDYCWSECTDEEQQKVKEVRAKMNKALIRIRKIIQKEY